MVDPDLELVFTDGSIVKAYQQSSGCKKREQSEIGRSVVGNSTKIHLAVSLTGNDDIKWGLYKERHFVKKAFVHLWHFRCI